jgi:hypothetical protein
LRQISAVAVVTSWIVDVVGTNAFGVLYVVWATLTRRVDPQAFRDQTAMMADPDVAPTLTLSGWLARSSRATSAHSSPAAPTCCTGCSHPSRRWR